MKNSEVAVSIKNLKKVYKVYDSPGQRFKSLLFKRNLGRDFMALNDISVDIAKGEAFAIVGKNGSGKSTMLQVLAGILKPTSGEIKVNGRVAALLELGSGFNPESTGYENIYMNAAILGLKKNEIEQKVQDIIEFADIGQHLYEPVKTYSSGMYVRLGFAVAINVEADVLLVDEALAVGDVFFRQKCYSKLNELKKKGTTIILVTHNMVEVEQFCDRALLLNMGKQISIADSSKIVKEYYLMNEETAPFEVTAEDENIHEVEKKEENEYIIWKDNFKILKSELTKPALEKIVGSGKVSISGVGLFDKNGEKQSHFEQGDVGVFVICIEPNKKIEFPFTSVMIKNQKNIIVHGKDSLQLGLALPQLVKENEKIFFKQQIKFDIAAGEYTYEMGVASISKEIYYSKGTLLQEEFDKHMERLSMITNVGAFSIGTNTVKAFTNLKFHGLCDLPGETDYIIKKK